MNKILKYQGLHLFGFIIIGFLLILIFTQFEHRSITVFNFTSLQWIIFSWIFAGLHQAWIMLFWRLEFYYGKISSKLGKAGFTVYRIGFIIFGTLRLASIIPISICTANLIKIPLFLTILLISVSSPFIIWGLYSVIAYFGINRAFGADHFDASYRNSNLEKRGIFKYIQNSMYTIILLILYHPGLFWQSPLGLLAAGAHHLFVWFHYFCTEKPDMKEIYGF